MDVVLEITDSFIGDYVYAWAHPANPAAPYDYLDASNATAHSSWQYKPASTFFYIEPSQSAYMSAWDRDNIFRQGISLFMITWFVLKCNTHNRSPLVS